MTTFYELFDRLNQRATEDPIGSRTAELLSLGTHEIGKKIVEEAAEVWMAAEFQSKQELATEISQLIYHLQVLMINKDLSMKDVEGEL